jgi:hypothetical protein
MLDNSRLISYIGKQEIGKSGGETPSRKKINSIIS